MFPALAGEARAAVLELGTGWGQGEGCEVLGSDPVWSSAPVLPFRVGEQRPKRLFPGSRQMPRRSVGGAGGESRTGVRGLQDPQRSRGVLFLHSRPGGPTDVLIKAVL